MVHYEALSRQWRSESNERLSSHRLLYPLFLNRTFFSLLYITQIRFIGSVPTPWPSWSIAASTSTVLSSTKLQPILKDFLTKLDLEIKKFSSSNSISDGSSSKYIIDLLEYKPEDVKTWLNGVRWCGDSRSNDGLKELSEKDPSICPPPITGQNTTTKTVSKETLEITLDTLEKAGVCRKPKDGWKVEDFIEETAISD